jgi:hypothetical protein
MQVHDIEMKERRSARLGWRVVAAAKLTANACERHPAWLLSAYSALYLVVVGLIAVRKQLENDALFTLNIARLPTMPDVWSALLTGAEQLPPFFYVLTRASLSLFGENNIALRLPSILGFWVMSLCLFWFVSKRSTSLYGLVAMLFVLTTGAYYYAFEARPYALVLGFSGLALLCWQSLADGSRRAPSLMGLALGLAAAVACHYYAVLVLIPFACGEAVRTWVRRRIDFAVWAAIAASLVPLLIAFPLIKSARAYSKTFWAQPSWGDIPGFYYFMLMSAALPIAAILILAALYTSLFSEARPEVTEGSNHARRFGLLPHEVAVAVGFLAIPVVAVAMAMLVTGAFTNRYALPAVLGLGMLAPFAFHPLLRGREVLTILFVICFAAGFVRRGGMTLQDSAKRVQSREGAVRMLQTEGHRELPVVCSDPHVFLLLSHYAPPDVRSRLVYLADPEASLPYLGHNSIEQGMFDLLKPWFGLNVQAYRPFLASQKPFLLCGDPQYFLNWVLRDLASSDMRLELKGQYKEILLFLVSGKTQSLSEGRRPGNRPGNT